MKTEIYCLSHKEFTPPSDKIYIPLSVFENKGENIADKNIYYSELTGCYFAWKNSVADIIGIAHYRRYLLNEKGGLLSESEIQELLKNHDLIVPKVLTLNFPYEYGFSKNHKPYYLEELRKLLSEEYPQELRVYDELIKGVNTLFGNMLIARAELFKAYHAWLFEILFKLESRITIDEPDSYHRRIFGFISEFLLYLYIKLRGLKAAHVMVGMIGEKTEVRALKEKLWEYLSKGQVFEAKECFLTEYKKRPDLLMEASDIGRELRLTMEAISIAEHELAAGVETFLTNIKSYEEMLRFVRRLNKEAERSICPTGVSPEAYYVAKTVMEARGL